MRDALRGVDLVNDIEHQDGERLLEYDDLQALVGVVIERTYSMWIDRDAFFAVRPVPFGLSGDSPRTGPKWT